MNEEVIEKFDNAIDETFRNKNPKFRDPSGRILITAREKINEEIKKSPDIVTDEELLQHAIAVKALFRIAEKQIENKAAEQEEELDLKEIAVKASYNTEVQHQIGRIMERPITEDQLSLLIALTPRRSILNAEATAYFLHYTGNWSFENGSLICDAEKSQKFIKAVNKIDYQLFVTDHRWALLDTQLRNEFPMDDNEQKIYDKGLATILNQEADMVKKDERDCNHAERMLNYIKELNKKDRMTKLFGRNPLATKAYKNLQKTCIETYTRKLTALSPLKEVANQRPVKEM